jgi:ubiquinone/menaquinone biosynthesis C-methylase UbiE
MASLIQKFEKGIKNPRLVVRFFLNKLDALFRKKHEWVKDESNIGKKKYEGYEEYLEHQKSKLEKIKDELHHTYDVKYRHELKKRLKEQNVVQSGMNVLCLAARIGTEVKSFLDLDCFAVGIDLNPGVENKYVVYGDFHDIQFSDHSVDVVFSNSLDHTFDFSKLIKEIKRVLKLNGSLILEIVKGTEEGCSPGYYEASSWKKIDDLLDIFRKSGFKIVKKVNFEYPWPGQHVVLTLKTHE